MTWENYPTPRDPREPEPPPDHSWLTTELIGGTPATVKWTVVLAVVSAIGYAIGLAFLAFALA